MCRKKSKLTQKSWCITCSLVRSYSRSVFLCFSALENPSIPSKTNFNIFLKNGPFKYSRELKSLFKDYFQLNQNDLAFWKSWSINQNLISRTCLDFADHLLRRREVFSSIVRISLSCDSTLRFPPLNRPEHHKTNKDPSLKVNNDATKDFKLHTFKLHTRCIHKLTFFQNQRCFIILQILVLEGNVITRKLLATNLNYTSTLLSDHLVFGPKFIFDYLEEH